jgi:hypothetical protein
LNESVATSGGEGVKIAELLTEYDQSLTTMLEGQVFTVTGTLDPTDSQPSRGKLYWYVVEDGARLKVCIAEREGQLSGQRVQVTGRLRRNVWRPRGYLELVLYVTRITALELPQEDWSGPLRDIGTQRQAAWPAVEQAIEHGIRAGMPPRVVLLVGTSAQVDQDVRAAVHEHASAYQLIVERVSMLDPVAVAEAVSVPRSDVALIAMVRGGGDGLSVFSDRQVCAAVAQTVSVPIVSALGHAGNEPLIQAMVHHAFDTPSLFGTWLKARAVAATDETARQVASLEGQREQLQQKLQAAEETRRAIEAQVQKLEQRQKTYHLVWGVVAVVVILVVILIVLGAR